jgi:DNA-binding CsgD family transcriptional regulator
MPSALAHASDPRQPLALLAAHRLLGELATDARQFADAEQHLQASLTLADACAAPYERALTLLALTQLRAITGDVDMARQHIDAVRTICVPLGATPTLARADALVAQLDAAHPATTSYPAGLSAREVEVLRLVAAGLSNPQVGERLFLSPRTVEQHLRSIFNKTSAPSRAAAARWAAENGIA